MVQCNHCIMGLGCGYTGAAALVLGHYALLVAQIAQTIIVPATFQSLFLGVKNNLIRFSRGRTREEHMQE